MYVKKEINFSKNRHNDENWYKYVLAILIAYVSD